MTGLNYSDALNSYSIILLFQLSTVPSEKRSFRGYHFLADGLFWAFFIPGLKPRVTNEALLKELNNYFWTSNVELPEPTFSIIAKFSS